MVYIRSVVNQNVVTRRIPVFHFERWLLPSDTRNSGDLSAFVATLAFFFLVISHIHLFRKAYWYERTFTKSYIPLCGPSEADSCARNQKVQPFFFMKCEILTHLEPG